MCFFCAMHLSSPLPCSSVVLHWVTETERCRCWVSYQLCCVCGSLRTNVMSALCRHCPTQQLALPPLAALNLSSCLFSSTSHLSLVTRGCVLLSCSVLLTFTWSLPATHPSSNFSEKVNAALLAAAESALTLFCQPGPASLPSVVHSVSSSPPLPLSLARSRHIKWPLTAASATRSNSDITPLYMRLQFLYK